MNFNALNLENRTSDLHNGQWLWPKDDYKTWQYLHKPEHFELPRIISALCNQHDIVIQAGGNCGIYPKQYSQIFKTVFTFEPDYKNFFCLTNNVIEKNVFKFQSCLGNSNTFLNLDFNPKWAEGNRGAMLVSGSGIIPQITIDSLGIEPDLIHLDIEGYEGFAIEGAEKTIKKSKPLIVLETNKSGDRYGWPQDKIDNLLFSWGYKILEKWRHDTVYQFAQ